MKTTELIDTQLPALGFRQEHTGGGCYLWRFDISASLHLAVIDETGGLPSDAFPATVCLMCEAHSEAITATTYPTGLKAVEMLAYSLTRQPSHP